MGRGLKIEARTRLWYSNNVAGFEKTRVLVDSLKWKQLWPSLDGRRRSLSVEAWMWLNKSNTVTFTDWTLEFQLRLFLDNSPSCLVGFFWVQIFDIWLVFRNFVSCKEPCPGEFGLVLDPVGEYVRRFLSGIECSYWASAAQSMLLWQWYM